MPEDLNNVSLVGRLTRDMELTHTSGGPLGKFALAVNSRRKNGEQWEDEASFFDLILWGKRAESLQRYLSKGSQIAVQGRLKQDRWEQDGQRRSRVIIDISNIQLLGGRSSEESPPRSVPPASFGKAANNANYPPPAPNVENNFIDDIPF